MQAKLVVATLVAVAALTGCTTTQEYRFGKEGASEADFHKDKTACEDEAFTARNLFGLNYIQARNDCLIKKGWSLTNPKN